MSLHRSFFPTQNILHSPLIQIFSYTKLIKFCGFLHENPTEFSLRIIQRQMMFLIAFIFKLVIAGI